jgi:hypothetical protein
MLIAVEEVLADARRYSEPPWLRVGGADAWFVCEIGVAGAVIDDPLAEFMPPGPAHPDRGELWVALQLTRELELVYRPHGRIVRLWV